MQDGCYAADQPVGTTAQQRTDLGDAVKLPPDACDVDTSRRGVADAVTFVLTSRVRRPAVEFPSLSWLHADQGKALRGLVELVGEHTQLDSNFDDRLAGLDKIEHLAVKSTGYLPGTMTSSSSSTPEIQPPEARDPQAD